MYYDTHVHSTFSPDAVSGMGEYATLIDNRKVKGIGFAEHVDFLPECGAYDFFDYGAYISAIHEYRSKGYEFLAGAEIDYAKKVEEDIKAHLKQNPYDFTICSIHMIDGFSISDGRNNACLQNEEAFLDLIEKYYFEVDSGLKAEAFDVLGHIGIYSRSLTEEFYRSKRIRERVAELESGLAAACAASNIIVEVNTSGFFAPCQSMIPGPAFLKKYFAYGGRRVSLGSDAHRSEHAVRGFDRAVGIIKSIGFEYIYLPWDKDRPFKLS